MEVHAHVVPIFPDDAPRSLRRERRSIYDWRQNGSNDFDSALRMAPARRKTFQEDAMEDEDEIHSEFKKRLMSLPRRNTELCTRSLVGVIEEAEEVRRRIQREREEREKLQGLLGKVRRSSTMRAAPSPKAEEKKEEQKVEKVEKVEESERKECVARPPSTRTPSIKEEPESDADSEFLPCEPEAPRPQEPSRPAPLPTPPTTAFDPAQPAPVLRLDIDRANKAVAPPLSIPSPPATPPLPPDFTTPQNRSSASTPAKKPALHLTLPDYYEPAPFPEDIIPDTPPAPPSHTANEFPFPASPPLSPTSPHPQPAYPTASKTPDQHLAARHAQHLRNLALHRRRAQLQPCCDHLFVSALCAPGKKMNPWLNCVKCGKKKLRQTWSGVSRRGSREEGGEWVETCEERVWVETFTDGERVWGRWEREERVYGEKVRGRSERKGRGGSRSGSGGSGKGSERSKTGSEKRNRPLKVQWKL